MEIKRIGLDLAKNVFEVHAVDEAERVVVRKTLRRGKVLEFFAQLPACVVGMEACGGAHHWARKLSELGHDARLMAPQFVAPYRKSNKTDRNDAQAICEAVGRGSMRFVPVQGRAAAGGAYAAPDARVADCRAHGAGESCPSGKAA